jgi:nitrite reductase/ring-hydroxylating ferredoxin subunit
MKPPFDKHQIARREFCRHIAYGLVASVAGGVPGVNWFVADVHADTLPPGQFLLNLAGFPALADVNGSVVLTLPGAPSGLAKIVVTRTAGDQFYAVDSTCAHNQCEVPPASYNAASAQNEITCGCHGSRYQANGELLEGPAQRGLRAFSATLVSPTQLRLDIPEFRFTLGVTGSQPVSGTNRLKLTFPALSFLTYNVRYRAALPAAWTTVPFSRFPNGPLIQTDYPGIGADGEVYVAAPQPAGFFSIITV